MGTGTNKGNQKMDRKAILEAVYRHFVVDGHRPPSANVYHEADTGRCCAIGLFDEDGLLADPLLNTRDIDDIAENAPGVLEKIFGGAVLTDSDEIFLEEIQTAHDSSAIPVQTGEGTLALFRLDIEARLQNVADDFNVYGLT